MIVNWVQFINDGSSVDIKSYNKLPESYDKRYCKKSYDNAYWNVFYVPISITIPELTYVITITVIVNL